MKRKAPLSSVSPDPSRVSPSPSICIPVCEPRAIDLRSAVIHAVESADIVELRLDYLQGDELFKALRGLPALISASPKPVIVTLRPMNQGGQREMDDLTRIIFWVEHFLYGKPHVDFADMELDVVRIFQTREKDEGKTLLDWDRVICSQHYFENVPSDLNKIYAELASTPASVLKLAVRAHDAIDCIPVFKLLEQARRDGRKMIAIAMGQAGIATRILGPALGGFLTYAALDKAHQTAPGQVSAAELRDCYRINKLNAESEVLGLIGSPVSHSLSPRIHNAAFDALDLNAVYLPLEVHDLGAFVRRMVHPRTREIEWRLRGLSVTAPHKSAVIEHLDWCDPEAAEIGAVNTIEIEGERLLGYNTDAAAFTAPLTAKGIELSNGNCAVIGAGGVARAVLWSLRKKGARATVFARDVAKASSTAEEFGADFRQLDGASFAGFDVVVNATPLGTRGQREMDTAASAEQLRGAGIAYDLVYNPSDTRFQREARQAGCETIGGLAMLIEQAALQFKIWMKQAAPRDVMTKEVLSYEF